MCVVMKKILMIIMLFFTASVYSQQFELLPKSKGEIIEHKYYTLSYLENFEQAEWVYYVLTPEMLKGSANRTNDFRVDPKVSSGSAQLIDYKNSGYDRGHLAPAGDMKRNRSAMSESFYMSNISPQSPSFNRGIWRSLEVLVRKWASREKLYIATGGILVSGLQEIGINGVDVPKHFYKVVYDPDNGKMIAFVLPNEKGQKSLKEYVVSVDRVERLTGIDFFPQLIDEIEENLESKINLFNWTFSTNKSFNTSTSKSFNTLISSQCTGIAKSTRVQCRNKTKNKNGYCYIHKNQSPDYVKPQPSGYVGRCNATHPKGDKV